MTVWHGEKQLFPCPFVYRISRHHAKSSLCVKENSILSHPSFSCTQLDSHAVKFPLNTDTVKSILLYSGFMNSTSICLFSWAQQLGDREQERVEEELFDLHLAALSFIWWPLILALERSVKVNPLSTALEVFQLFLHLPSAVSFSRARILYCSLPVTSALTQFKTSNLVLCKILIRY